MEKKHERQKLFSKKILVSEGSPGQVRFSCDKPAKKFPPKIQTFFAQSSKKMEKKKCLRKKTFFLKIFFWTCKMPFWQRCCNVSAKIPKFCSQTPKTIECIFGRKFFLKLFFWSRRMQFWQTCRRFLPIVRIFFDKCTKRIRKTYFLFKNKDLHQNVPLDT